MASIKKLPSGKYRARYRDHTGREHPGTSTGRQTDRSGSTSRLRP
jgi:hypothetical protein